MTEVAAGLATEPLATLAVPELVELDESEELDVLAQL